MEALSHHSHSFGQDKKRPGETRTIMVIAITTTIILGTTIITKKGNPTTITRIITTMITICARPICTSLLMR